ncbi:hypothetical protein Ngar_c16590 [Candidatus Nitrososphaera gargensis Ga9.2]|uniref:Uncharacterized protein n=1 Tax=Nitrososphaera gargensis (strain Ga9.2) TaxID=1237085 RepID=K0IJY8_NITGG|nr:hypothetical protein Ngar_c16590 [Candidatus Nitrososphaera gargensis Ga9.2]
MHICVYIKNTYYKLICQGALNLCMMKLYICQSCDAVFWSDLDAQHHSRNNLYGKYSEYDLEDLLARFLAQA